MCGKRDAAYRADGVGQAAFQPHMMVALLLYAYCLGVRSSRQIERLCERDVAFRVEAGNLRPDHATIARFHQRHSEALKGLFYSGPRKLDHRLSYSGGSAKGERWQASGRSTRRRSRPRSLWPPSRGTVRSTNWPGTTASTPR